MKNLTLFALALILLSSACTKEEDILTEVIEPGMFATIDGEKWESSITKLSLKNGIINLTGAGLNNAQTLTIIISDFQTGEFELNQRSAHIAAFMKTTYSVNAFTSNNSELSEGFFKIDHIDEVNQLISGSFELDLYQQNDTLAVQIREGQFSNISYTILDNEMSTKVNGETWTGAQFTSYQSQDDITVRVVGEDGRSSLKLNFPAATYAGSETIGEGGQARAFFYPDENTLLESQEGLIEIIKHDPNSRNIHARFSCKFEQENGNEIRLEEGSFFINY